ncbi:MAG: RDD family protein [Verrucomicrobiota bacterium]
MNKHWLLAGLMMMFLCAAAGAQQAPGPDNPADTILLDRARPAPEPPVPAEAPAPPATPEPKNSLEQNERRALGPVIRIGGDAEVRAGEMSREVIVIGGDAVIDGTVNGELIVISGKATINGKVNGETRIIFGSATVGPQAELRRQIVVLGGPLKTDPTAKISGQRVELGIGDNVPAITGVIDWLKYGLLMARPLPHQVGWAWVVAAAFLAIHGLVALLFPRKLEVCMDTIEKRPVGSFFTGLLTMVLFGPLIFLLIASVVGVIVVPFLLCGMLAAFVFGKASMYAFAGRQIGRQVQVGALQLPVAALVIGSAMFYLLYVVPVVGLIVWGMVSLVGLGSVTLAAETSLRRENREAHPAQPVQPLPGGGAAVAEGGAAVAGSSSAMDEALLPRVGFWRRFWAMALDALLFVFLLGMLGPVAVILWIAYHVAMWQWKGTTVGGIVMGIKVVREDGRPVSFAVALVRSLSSIFSLMALGIGFFWAGWTRDRQSWHDKIAGTIVVRVPKGMPLV